MKLPQNRKPRSDSLLDKLPVDLRTHILRWLFHDNLTCVHVAARLASDYQVKTSATAVHRFYQRTMDRRLAERAVQLHLRDFAPALHTVLNPLPGTQRKRRIRRKAPTGTVPE